MFSRNVFGFMQISYVGMTVICFECDEECADVINTDACLLRKAEGEQVA